METSVEVRNMESAAEGGQDFFVAPHGDDRNDGSIEHPLETITQALQVARNNGMDGGDRIYLRAGTYYPAQTLALLEHGSPKRWSYLAAWQNEHVIIDGSQIAPVNGQPAPLIYLEGSYYEISGLELVGAPKSAISLYGPQVRVIGNVIHDSTWGAVWSEPNAT